MQLPRAWRRATPPRGGTAHRQQRPVVGLPQRRRQRRHVAAHVVGLRRRRRAGPAGRKWRGVLVLSATQQWRGAASRSDGARASAHACRRCAPACDTPAPLHPGCLPYLPGGPGPACIALDHNFRPGLPAWGRPVWCPADRIATMPLPAAVPGARYQADGEPLAGASLGSLLPSAGDQGASARRSVHKQTSCIKPQAQKPPDRRQQSDLAVTGASSASTAREQPSHVGLQVGLQGRQAGDGWQGVGGETAGACRAAARGLAHAGAPPHRPAPTATRAPLCTQAKQARVRKMVEQEVRRCTVGRAPCT